jgi:hypothetical protein
MQMERLVLAAAVLWAVAAVRPGGAAGPRIEQLKASGTAVGRYEKFEITARIAATFENPFDPEQIEVEGEFKAPSGGVVRVPGFLYQEYTRHLEHGNEVLEKVGREVWKVRFAPVEVGRHRAFLRVRDRQGSARSDVLEFESTASRNAGFVRRSARVPTLFEFDSGQPYFPIGENICWPGPRGTYDYDDWLTALGNSGANYGRLWIGPFDCFTLERPRDHPGGPHRLGFYDLESAWRLDYVLEGARQNGAYLLLCLESFNSLRASEPFPFWQYCPYNSATGGPCKSPESFFTHPLARQLFKQRLRYLAARWAYSPNVLAWEFWNEVDIIEKYIAPQVHDWHREMARYMRRADPWKHMITTSFARSDGDEGIDGMPEMDFVQTHEYGSRDAAESLSRWSRQKVPKYGKPHIVGEFGTDWQGEGEKKDATGVCLHNGIWATALSGSAGSAMSWWWDSHVHPRDLYYHFRALSQFLENVNWIREAYRPARVECSAPGLMAIGLANQRSALVWLHNRAHTWQRVAGGEPVPPAVGASLTLTGLVDGKYALEWFDTWRGQVAKRGSAVAKNGVLELHIPEVGSDLACKVRLR